MAIAYAMAIAAFCAVACSVSPTAQPEDFQAPPTSRSSAVPAIGGQTQGYYITNESGTILIYQRVAGHVAAPPLQPGGAWLPGQTLNFELSTGFLGTSSNTGDALFEAYTVSGSGGLDAGNVDIHFYDFGNPSEAPGSAGAYLNPQESAPLVASSTLTPYTYNGETFTMWSHASSNTITSSSASTFDVPPPWMFSGATTAQLIASIKSSSDAQCATPSPSSTSCTLGGTSWMFTSG